MIGMATNMDDLAEGIAILEAAHLFRFYHAGEDETFALRGVSLSVDRGEIVAIVGPSGSGKSTLLACLAGLDEPDGGHVVVGGTRITRRPEVERAHLRARWIGILRESGNLFEHLTVFQNLVVARTLIGRDRDRPSVDALLEEVGLTDRANAHPSHLSGGESARAGLAVALANDPPVLLADEPTGELDDPNERLVLELLSRRAQAGQAIVLVTHSARAAREADRVIRLSDGRLFDV